MKLTKYPQSCALIECNNTKILVDPGKSKFEESFLEDWKKVDAIFVTHRHGDHCYAEKIKDLGIPIYSTTEVANYYPELSINIVNEGDVIEVGDLKITAVKAVHGYLVPAGEITENVGYIVDDGNKKIYFTSDTIRFKNDYKADVLFVDITAFDASMNLWGASQTYKDVGADLMIVAHQDEGKMFYPSDVIESYLKEQDVNFVVPKILESIEI